MVGEVIEVSGNYLFGEGSELEPEQLADLWKTWGRFEEVDPEGHDVDIPGRLISGGDGGEWSLVGVVQGNRRTVDGSLTSDDGIAVPLSQVVEPRLVVLQDNGGDLVTERYNPDRHGEWRDLCAISERVGSGILEITELMEQMEKVDESDLSLDAGAGAKRAVYGAGKGAAHRVVKEAGDPEAVVDEGQRGRIMREAREARFRDYQ
jgi:hypothetical protein